MKKQKELRQKLDQYEINGVLFHDAKQALLKDGYSESEISIAVASSPFDGKPNHSHEPTENEKFYIDNPDAAKAVGDRIMENQAELRRQETILKGLAALTSRMVYGPVHPASTQSEVGFSDHMGIPYFRIMGAILFIAACLFGLQTFNIISIDVFYWFIKTAPVVVGVALAIEIIVSKILFYSRKKRRSQK